jgi:hypothetical protein
MLRYLLCSYMYKLDPYPLICVRDKYSSMAIPYDGRITEFTCAVIHNSLNLLVRMSRVKKRSTMAYGVFGNYSCEAGWGRLVFNSQHALPRLAFIGRA